MQQYLCFIETFSVYVFHGVTVHSFIPSTRPSQRVVDSAKRALQTFQTLWRSVRTMAIYFLRIREGDPECLRDAALQALKNYASVAEKVSAQVKVVQGPQAHSGNMASPKSKHSK
jgi:hypothetical protein